MTVLLNNEDKNEIQVTYNVWQENGLMAEKIILLNVSDFKEWLKSSEFANIIDFEENYNSEDIMYDLKESLDYKELLMKKRIYKMV